MKKIIINHKLIDDIQLVRKVQQQKLKDLHSEIEELLSVKAIDLQQDTKTDCTANSIRFDDFHEIKHFKFVFNDCFVIVYDFEDDTMKHYFNEGFDEFENLEQAGRVLSCFNIKTFEKELDDVINLACDYNDLHHVCHQRFRWHKDHIDAILKMFTEIDLEDVSDRVYNQYESERYEFRYFTTKTAARNWYKEVHKEKLIEYLTALNLIKLDKV